jgi:hypothetical protein
MVAYSSASVVVASLQVTLANQAKSALEKRPVSCIANTHGRASAVPLSFRFESAPPNCGLLVRTKSQNGLSGNRGVKFDLSRHGPTKDRI